MATTSASGSIIRTISTKQRTFECSQSCRRGLSCGHPLRKEFHMSTPPTVLITGCSSGFGLATAHFFLDKGWHVVATMRTPRADLLPPSDRLRVLALDVTDAESVRRCVAEAGEIDALVNNAGIGVLAPLEGTAMADAREVFETNVLGTIAMTQAV